MLVLKERFRYRKGSTKIESLVFRLLLLWGGACSRQSRWKRSTEAWKRYPKTSSQTVITLECYPMPYSPLIVKNGTMAWCSITDTLIVKHLAGRVHRGKDWCDRFCDFEAGYGHWVIQRMSLINFDAFETLASMLASLIHHKHSSNPVIPLGIMQTGLDRIRSLTTWMYPEKPTGKTWSYRDVEGVIALGNSSVLGGK